MIGVARFTDAASEEKLRSHGVETIRCDLLDEDGLARLPDAPNVVYMAGRKFGTTGQEAATWAMNAYLPGPVCRRYRASRIVAFSTGNVYGLVPVAGGGSREADAPDPRGEYAMSCLGRERIFEHFSRTLGIPMALIRLNYATEMRYGVLVDIAGRVRDGLPIDLAVGSFNVIWQGDANAMTLQAFDHVATPALDGQRDRPGDLEGARGRRDVRPTPGPAGGVRGGGDPAGPPERRGAGVPPLRHAPGRRRPDDPLDRRLGRTRRPDASASRPISRRATAASDPKEPIRVTEESTPCPPSPRRSGPPSIAAWRSPRCRSP